MQGRRYGRGGVRLIGCSPGCLVMSILLSVALTVAVNLILWLLSGP